MPVVLVFLAAIAIFALAYVTYGRLLARLFGLDATRPVPSATQEDGVDFVPTRPAYLLGQHFSSITAAGPIVGPIVAAIYFGWLPALLWVVIGAVFIGACTISGPHRPVRHQARSVAEIARAHEPSGLHPLPFLRLAGADLRRRLSRHQRPAFGRYACSPTALGGGKVSQPVGALSRARV
jgi:carbon starvation protein